MRQIELDIPIAIRQQYVSIVEYRLREPKITAGVNFSGVSGRSGLPQSSTEQAVLNMFDKLVRLQDEIWEVEDQLYPMERALRTLNHEQLKLIESKYFCREEELDDYLNSKFSWYRAKYYSVKKTALILLAQLLRIV